jgi:hypothetical protein
MRRRSMIFACALAAIVLASMAIQSRRSAVPTLAIRRARPAGDVLRGSPNSPVVVELVVTNNSRRPIEIAPLRLSCSCQLATSPDKVIAAHEATSVVLNLQFPPAHTTSIPIEFNSPAGTLLARTDIVLEADTRLPYFLRCPDFIEIPIIRGVSDPIWRTSAITLEDAALPQHIIGVSLASGAEYVRIDLAASTRELSGTPDVQRTYQLTFEVHERGLDHPDDATPIRGVAILELSDGIERRLPWAITHQSPLALKYEPGSSRVRGVRRAGAEGAVTFRVIPESGGTLTPAQFDVGVPIVATLEAGSTKPQRIEALYHGRADPVTVSLMIPEVTHERAD